MFLKMLKLGTSKVRLQSYIVQKARIRYDWSFLLLKMLKQVTTGVLKILIRAYILIIKWITRSLNMVVNN